MWSGRTCQSLSLPMPSSNVIAELACRSKRLFGSIMRAGVEPHDLAETETADDIPDWIELITDYAIRRSR
jgi:hypothetical protein